MKLSKRFWVYGGILMFVGASLAQADIAQIKNYKEAFPGEKPKCVACHADALPKKADGQHEMNAYGKKVLEVSKTPTVETYKTAGKAS